MDVGRLFSFTDNTLEEEALHQRFDLAENEYKRIVGILDRYAWQSLEVLAADNPGFLVFPSNFKTIRDGIEERSLFNLHRRKNGEFVQTGNVAGFFGLRSEEDGGTADFQILSRFDSDNRQFFLFYLLERISASHVVDLPSRMSDREKMQDLAVCLFPFILQTALSKGMFRSYRTFNRNDDLMSGSLDADRHLAANVPFAGRIAYSVRERCADNMLMQLVRHTIEFISAGRFSAILTGSRLMRECVARVREATPSYSRGQRALVISRNLKPVRHPYYTEYTQLQQISLKILRREKFTYQTDTTSEVNGIVFAVDWLWEEYLARILSEQKWNGFLSHPRNKDSKSGESIHLFAPQNGVAYPDFMLRASSRCSPQDEDVILDAKYQRLSSANGKYACVPRPDRLQMITYLHVTQAKYGIFLFPKQPREVICVGENDAGIPLSNEPIRLGHHVNGCCCKGDPNLHPEIWIVPFEIPAYSVNTTFVDFCRSMKAAELKFVTSLKGIIHC